MYGKLLEIAVAAKSGALSGVLIVAGAVAVSAGQGISTAALEEHASPTRLIAAHGPADPDVLDEDEDDEGEPAKKPTERDAAARPVALKPERSCAAGATARAKARERVAAALATHRAALDEVRATPRSDRALEALEKADAMLREIAEKADHALAEMCDEVGVVADRAVAAMETVVNLARSAATATPTPTTRPSEKPRPTEKPKETAKATSKPTRTPSCEDRLYQNKLKMAAAFEKWHGLHDRLYFEYKRSTNTAMARTVIANDALLHSTYEDAKKKILSAGCAGDFGAAHAALASANFERTYFGSAAAVASVKR